MGHAPITEIVVPWRVGTSASETKDNALQAVREALEFLTEKVGQYEIEEDCGLVIRLCPHDDGVFFDGSDPPPGLDPARGPLGVGRVR